MRTVLLRDPLSFKKISAEERHIKILYGLVIAIMGCFILALLFFIISLAVSSA